jgi:hypothetical protein
VFLGYSSHHKGVKCLDPSTGRVYIFKDVVFDESVFPSASLNHHVGKRLQKDILLFPTHTSSTRDAHLDDYMPLPVIPNVTNVHDSDISHTAIQVDAHQNTEHDNPEPSSGSKTDASSATSEEDPTDSDSAPESAGADPEVDPTGSPMPLAPATSPDPMSPTRSPTPSSAMSPVSTSLLPSPTTASMSSDAENLVHTPSPPPLPLPAPPLVVPRTRLQHGLKKEISIFMPSGP